MPRHLNRELQEAGKRIADQINARIASPGLWDVRNMWMAFDLNDGTSRGEMYESLAEAKRFTDEYKTAYFALKGCLAGVTPFDAAVYLDFCREARDANLGHRDPNKQAFLSFTGGDIMQGRN